MGGNVPMPPDALKARIRTLLTAQSLTPAEATEYAALAAAYRDLRRAERHAPTSPAAVTPAPYRGVDPRRHVPFSCTGCGRELRPRQDHGILAGYRILCPSCLAGDDSPVLVLAVDRAAATRWLDDRGLIDPEPSTSTEGA